MTIPPYPASETGTDYGRGDLTAESTTWNFRLGHRDLPLRTWLVIIIVLISGLGLAGSSVAVSSIMREVTYAQVDDELINSASGWARNEGIFNADRGPRPPSDYVVLKLFDDGSSVIFNDPGPSLDLTGLEVEGPPRTIHSSSNESFRAISFRENGVTTVVARTLEGEHTLLLGLAMVQAVISLLVLAILALLGYYFIRQAMAPLREVERTAKAIADGDLDRRVPQWPRGTEVGQLAYALNIMLGQLQDSIESAQEKEAQMRRFVGDASHELRTPLTSVRGYTELYRSGATNNVDLVFSKIDAESQRMSLLVEDLLALTRAEGSRLERAKVDLLETSLAVASSARAAFPGRSVAVINSTSSIPIVEGDAARLHQVLLNLVSNGLIHGGESAAVSIELSLDGNDVLVSVRDDGRGMPPDVASHIFERFYREDASRSRASGGSGLGLAITKSLVEAHRGTISVSSVPGEGSEFIVRLPRMAD